MGDSTGVAVGEEVPDARGTLVTPDGETTETALAELLADRPVLFTFYTNDFSPDCIKEWCSFRDYDWFTSNDAVQVIGASKSRPFNHRKFIDYLDLQFPLYADTDLELAAAFGVDYRVFKLVPPGAAVVFPGRHRRRGPVQVGRRAPAGPDPRLAPGDRDPRGHRGAVRRRRPRDVRVLEHSWESVER